MRKIVTLSLVAITAAAQAQFITLRDHDHAVVNGTTVTYSGMANEPVMEVHLEATLNSGADRVINVKRYEMGVQPGTQNYFCWGICYGPQDAGALPFWASLNQHSLVMQEGVTLTNFGAYHSPNGVEGASTYRFVWYDTTNPNDSVWADIVFQSMPVGVEELGARVRTMNVYPNPSLGNNVEFQIELAEGLGSTALVVYDMLGARVSTTRLNATNSRTVLPVSGMAAGVYFASVEQNGTALATRRFVVTR